MAILNGVKNKINFLVIFILISVLMFSGFQCTRQDRAKPISLVVWNLWDDESSWKDMIASYEASVAADQTRAPIKIVYYKKLLAGNENYEDDFKEALSQGNGPDIITLNNSWLPRYKNKIYPLDQGAKTAQSYQRKFVDTVSYDFLEENKIYAVPLSLDSLALYYNMDMLNAAGIFDPPRTWDEFNEAVRKLTVRDDSGNIKRAGAAIGTDKNINRSSDILSLLMLQSGSSIVSSPDSKNIRSTNFNSLIGGSNSGDLKRSIGTTALQFYTDFANPVKTVYTWNPLMDYSIDALSDECGYDDKLRLYCSCCSRQGSQTQICRGFNASDRRSYRSGQLCQLLGDDCFLGQRSSG